MRGLDRYITGNDGLDYFRGFCEEGSCSEEDEVDLEECPYCGLLLCSSCFDCHKLGGRNEDNLK